MSFDSIEREALERKIARAEIDNDDPDEGAALINVLSPDAYAQKHIPTSVNIPLDEIGRCEARYGKDKEIIVYCASADCDASPRAARALTELGFTHVLDFAGGTAEWEQANTPIGGLDSTPSPTPS